MDIMLGELSVIRSGLTELCVSMAREQERAAFREAVIDRLHAENQALRRGELESMVEPMRSGLYRLYHLARKQGEQWSQPTPPPASQAAPLFLAIADEIAEILKRMGIEPFEPKAGEPFDGNRHRPVDTARVEDPALDGVVIETLASGFIRGEQIMRRADVVIGRLASPGGESGTPGQGTASRR